VRLSWKVIFATFLVGLSDLLYTLHVWIFRDTRHIFIYLLGDIAFVPIDVLLVALVLEHILEAKQKQNRLAKMNMVIDAFFSEVGNPLLRLLDGIRRDNETLQRGVQITTQRTDKDFTRAQARWKAVEPVVRPGGLDPEALKTFLSPKKPFLLGLLQNPTLLEHDTATDMLWALSHLTEEIIVRRDLKRLSQADQDHLAGDIRRAYSRIGTCRIDHVRHLKKDYPYLYSPAVRMNPFRPEARAEIS